MLQIDPEGEGKSGRGKKWDELDVHKERPAWQRVGAKARVTKTERGRDKSTWESIRRLDEVEQKTVSDSRKRLQMNNRGQGRCQGNNHWIQ